MRAGSAAFHAQQELQHSRSAAYEMANASRQGNANVGCQTSHTDGAAQQHSHRWDTCDSGSRPAELTAERVRNGSNGDAGVRVQHEQQQESQQRHADRGKDDTAAATQPNQVVSASSGDKGLKASSESQRPASNGSEPTKQSNHANSDEQQRDVPSHKSALEEQQNKQGIPHSWDDATVLQFLHEHSAMSSEEVVEKLQMPSGFVSIDSSEEDCLVLAACRQSSMLSMFRAYAPYNVLQFISFARKGYNQS